MHDTDTTDEALAFALFRAKYDAMHPAARERVWAGRSAMERAELDRMARAALAFDAERRAADEALLREVSEMLGTSWWPGTPRNYADVRHRLHARLHGAAAAGEEGDDVDGV